MSLLQAPDHLLTVEEYEELDRQGAFPPDQRVELLNGKINYMSPTGRRHLWALGLLNTFLARHSRDRFVVSPQGPILLDPHSEPEPDIVLLSAEPAARLEKPRPRIIFLAIEVSDSTVRYDRLEKGPAYAAQGIPEYWILNLDRNQLEVYRQPSPAGYREQLTLTAEEKIAPLAFPDLLVRVGDYLP